MIVYYITNPPKNSMGLIAKKYNIPHFRILPKTTLFQYGLGCKQKRVDYDNINNPVATEICQNKALTKQFLEDLSIPIPKGEKIENETDLKNAFEKLQKPIVLKPISEMWGKGITTNIDTWEAAQTAYKIASSYKGPYVVAEEHAQGDDHRILILNGKYIAGLRRTPPFIIGNGKDTITELIEKENKKRESSEAIVKEILIDETVEEFLKSQSLNSKSILEKDQKVYVRMTGNICSGGVSTNITNDVHPSIIEMCIEIGAYLDMELLGVDIITTDITKPLSETGGKITEVNENPDINMHTAPYEGKPVMTTQLFIDYLFPNPKEAWIDISINGKTVEKREELTEYMDSIPKKIIQFIDKNSQEKTTLDSPDKPLYQYLLDVRTTSVEL